MAWLLQNWFWVLVAIIFVGVHFVGHGGHGGHSGHGQGKADVGDDPLHASDKDEQASHSHDHQHKGDRSC